MAYHVLLNGGEEQFSFETYADAMDVFADIVAKIECGAYVYGECLTVALSYVRNF